MTLWFVNQQCILSVLCADTMFASAAASIDFCDFQDTTIDLTAEGTSVVKVADTVSDLTYSL